MLKWTAIFLLACFWGAGAAFADPTVAALTSDPTLAAPKSGRISMPSPAKPKSDPALSTDPTPAVTKIDPTPVASNDAPAPTAPNVDPTPAAPKSDPRIKRYVYSENAVYRMDLYLKSVTALQFSDSEEVQTILIGDSASWEVVKLKSGNVVSIKPIIASATTNMTIYTNRHVYAFELHSLGEFAAGAGETPLFRSIFTYPEEATPKPVNHVPVARQVNSDYLAAGDAEFRPRWVQDDGWQTSFFLADGAPRPAIFKVGPDRKEQLINSRTQGNRILVDGTSNFWVLRIGAQAVCVGRTSAVSMNPTFTKGTEAPHAG
jgi:type IV secretion system protein VirB9